MKVPLTAPRPLPCTPPRCPYPACSGHVPGQHFRYRKKGAYARADGHRVQRFLCLECHRTFSEQTFALSHRLKRPELTEPIFELIVSKVTQRQIARTLGIRREIVEHRLLLLGRHGRCQHEYRLAQLAHKDGLVGRILLDELETFETHRKLKPVTAAIAIEEETGLLIHAEVAALPPRGNRTPAEERQLAKIEAVEGKRRSGSRQAIRKTFDVLARIVAKEGPVRLRTDRKSSYVSEFARRFGERCVHERISGQLHRGPNNPLFPINHTLARARDGISRLVRRSWGASKRRARLVEHLWVWIAYRNYVAGWRSEPTWKRRTSAAVQLGIERRKFSAEEFLRWADPLIPLPA